VLREQPIRRGGDLDAFERLGQGEEETRTAFAIELPEAEHERARVGLDRPQT
jgi:hypothetical protein